MNTTDLSELSEFTRAIIGAVRAIPAGEVSSYGAVAAAAGSPRAARQVVRVLASCSGKYALPWHRVVNKAGCIALKDPALALDQLARLRAEDVEVSDSGRVLQPFL